MEMRTKPVPGVDAPAPVLTMNPALLRADLVDRLRLARRDLAGACGPERDRIAGFIDGLGPAIAGSDLVVRCHEVLGPVALREVEEIVAEVAAA
jgi:hypothetical protein